MLVQWDKLARQFNSGPVSYTHLDAYKRQVLDSPEFKALWDRIKYKTTYRVQFDNERLIRDCITAVIQAPPISKTRLPVSYTHLDVYKRQLWVDAPSTMPCTRPSCRWRRPVPKGHAANPMLRCCCLLYTSRCV